MKKTSLLLIAAFVLLLSGVANAEVDVYADIDKTKTVTVTEDVNIVKDVDINVDSEIVVKGAAESDSVLNQSKSKITVGAGERQDDMKNYRSAVIAGSVNGNTGIVQVNQDTGNMNNQANLTSIAVVLGGTDNLANAQADTEQKSSGNTVFAVGDGSLSKQEMIFNSINGNSGIVGVNQSVGNMNNQANQVSIAVADNSLVALSEADLGQSLTNNTVIEYGTTKVDAICGSVIGNKGIVGVNQSAGNLNNQSNIVSISGGM